MKINENKKREIWIFLNSLDFISAPLEYTYIRAAFDGITIAQAKELFAEWEKEKEEKYSATMKALMSEPIYADEQQQEDELTYRLERDEELRQTQSWKFEE